jgi:DNA-binding NarL/FixJ family response regulator
LRLLIVDDHEVVREGLRLSLSSDRAIDVVGTAGTGAEAMTQIRRTLPDVALTDLRLPDTDGSTLCARIRADYPSTRVVVLTTYLSEEIVRQVADAGASAFVTKASGLAELRAVLEQVARGEDPLRGVNPEAVVDRLHGTVVVHDARPLLTPRQERVLELAADGLTYAEIGRRLFISESTVRFHIQALKARLGARTKTELIATAIRTALIAPGPDAVAV